MSVTEKLLKVYRLDQQLDGLKRRLNAAERFLSEQEQQLSSITQKQKTVQSQLRQLTASIADAEGEMSRIDVKIEALRERMNNASTSKEYKAVLAELNTLKEKRGEHESRALEMMEKSEALTSQTSELGSAAEERSRLRGAAESERGKRSDEIAGRLAELEAERATAAGALPAAVLQRYEALVARLEEEAMAPIEVQDRKRHEYTCGACMMSLPVETMSALLSTGEITHCVSCGCILFLDETAKTQMLTPTKR